MLTPVLRWLNNFNEGHPWSHNDHYHRWILGQLPRQVPRALDVGCGTGNLVRALAEKVEMVTGIDSDLEVLGRARRLSVDHPNVSFEQFVLPDLPGPKFDLVTAVAVVHHIDLGEALSALRRVMAPGGRMLLVGCYRSVTTLDFLIDCIAIPANVVMGLVKSRQSTAVRDAMSAPTAAAATTLADVRATAARALPGSRIRRRLLWRYTLSYSDQ